MPDEPINSSQENLANRETIPPPQSPSNRETIPPPQSISNRETVPPSSVDSFPGGAQDNQPGTEFGRYQIIECLGAGAMGTVYKAKDQQLDRTVALKIPKFADPDLLKRFYREARSAATVTHPNICPVHDVGEINGTHYISMGFIEGKELSAFIKPGKPQPIKQIVAVIRKLAIALDEAHRTGIVHRDLKPDNIMIDKRGTPIIMDFGLALRDAPGDARMTQAGSNQIMGTPAYMSPEQVDNDQDKVGPSSDVYSLGIMLYEMLTSQLPYQGSVAAVLAQIINPNPKPPGQLRADLDPKLEAVCLKMMAASQDERYESMREVAKTLTAYIKELGQTANKAPQQAARATTTPNTRSVNESSFEPLPQINTTDFSGASQTPSKANSANTKTDSANANNDIGSTSTPKTNPEKAKTPLPWVIISAAATVGALSLWGVITLFVSSGNQTVKIEIDDPKALLFVDGQQVTIKNLGAEIELTPGPHGYQIRRGDVVVKADSFTVLDGENEVVSITVLNGKSSDGAIADANSPKPKSNSNPRKPTHENRPNVKPVQPKPNASPDPSLTKAQQAAHDWVLANAKKTYFEVFNNGRRSSGFTGQGGKLQNGANITRIEFEHDSLVTSQTKLHLRELKSLKDLNFTRGLSDATAAHLVGLPLHHVFSSAGAHFTDVGAGHLAKISSLREAVFSNAMTIKAIDAFADHPSLSILTLDRCQLNDADWKALGRLPKLERLTIQDIKISPIGLKAILTNCSNLKNLQTHRVKISDDAARAFEVPSQIEQLQLNEAELTDDGLAIILQLPELIAFELTKAQLTAGGLELLRDNQTIKSLKLANMNLTENGLESLASMPNLEVLDLRDSDVTNASFAVFKGHPRLNLLTLAGTQVTDDLVETLLTLPRLASLSIQNTRFTKDAAAKLRKVKSNVRVIGAQSK